MTVVDAENTGKPTSASGKPLTKRGEATRTKLLAGAEQVFADAGYHEASIVKITERAEVGLGTFYLYFDSKQAIFEALVIDLNRRVRRSMTEEMSGATSRLEAERSGFAGFFKFTAAHPALYRVVREAEFVSPETLRLHYQRIVDGYAEGLRAAQATGEVDAVLEPEVAAWALMGVGELIGMRFLLWERDEHGQPATELDPQVFDAMMRFVGNAMGANPTAGVNHD